MESKPATAPTETPAAPNPPPVAPEANEEKGSGNPIEGNFSISGVHPTLFRLFDLSRI